MSKVTVVRSEKLTVDRIGGPSFALAQRRWPEFTFKTTLSCGHVIYLKESPTVGDEHDCSECNRIEQSLVETGDSEYVVECFSPTFDNPSGYKEQLRTYFTSDAKAMRWFQDEYLPEIVDRYGHNPKNYRLRRVETHIMYWTIVE